MGVVSSKLALERLIRGNHRFIKNDSLLRDNTQMVEKSSAFGSPYAVVLGCMDSRVPPELIFDVGLGEIFVVRVAGNVVGEDVLASVEYACAVINIPLLVVLGHTDCRAVISSGSVPPASAAIKSLFDRIGPFKSVSNGTDQPFVANVLNSIQELRRSDCIALLEQKGKLKIVGALYHVTSGEVQIF